MPLTPDEVAEIAKQVADLSAFLNTALRRDDTGKSRIDKAESKELLRRLTTLAAVVARDAID